MRFVLLYDGSLAIDLLASILLGREYSAVMLPLLLLLYIVFPVPNNVSFTLLLVYYRSTYA